ncbi:hypothetical protein KC207_09275 [Phycicoccus sp. BSK3Z-2]|uniref:ATP-grasp domain-containing protein n=1 Tax=Phycicoccus avicenniae TaxID=2828860 RepID=A0A941DAL3_9MICO|nr:ATP-grasp fold amidoligase family protein [Phycicoccus avicenniae]MBR7743477.1 hypothetical protein [Phycicoccus avicenniae]
MSATSRSAGADLRGTLRRLERAVARRGRLVARLTAQVAILTEETRSPMERTLGTGPDREQDLGVASYVLAARMHRRHHVHVNAREGLREPILDLAPKLPGRAWAVRNGVRVARELGRWPDPDAVDWDALPDRFVLKSSIGAGGVNVFPLVRRPDGGWTDMLTGEPTTRAEVTQALWSRHGDRSTYFAEEFLVGRGGRPGDVPDDVKVFCFYGRPFYVEVRRGDQSRARDVTPRVRTFTADGTELHHVRALLDPGDGDVGEPSDLATVVEVAGRLSATIRRPLQRLDFFETGDGLVFGEVTLSPGHPPALGTTWDRRMGEAYEDAYGRLLADLAAEGALGVTFGDGPVSA